MGLIQPAGNTGIVPVGNLSGTELKAYEELRLKLSSQRWRLNNLYKIVDAGGNIIPFKMNHAQTILFLTLWYCSLILKSRQHGVTTWACLLALDQCLFNSNYHACIIAHNREDAEDFFQKKILFAYNHLAPMLRREISANRESSKGLQFSNGSSIRVTTSGRSGTYQFVHVSELGKICARYPLKADEIMSGTLNAVHPGQIVIIESTAEGREGHFYDLCTEAQKKEAAVRAGTAKLSKLDWKFFFFGWFDNVLNNLDPSTLQMTSRLSEYFEKVEPLIGRRLTLSQKAWYVAREATQGELMLREHPSTPEEAFLASIQGTYYQKLLLELRKKGQIGPVPIMRGIPVRTWWDIGYNDANAIWFTQDVGRFVNLVHYYENSGEGLVHYAKYLQDVAKEREFPGYSAHYGPHDVLHSEWLVARKRVDVARDYGINFDVVGRTDDVGADIELCRKLLPACFFDQEHCDRGLACLEAYRKEWNERLGCYRDRPLHDWTSNGADAFRTLAVGHGLTASFGALGSPAASAGSAALDAGKKDPRGWSA